MLDILLYIQHHKPERIRNYIPTIDYIKDIGNDRSKNRWLHIENLQLGQAGDIISDGCNSENIHKITQVLAHLSMSEY